LNFATAAGTPDTDSAIELIRANWKKLGVGLTVHHYPSPLLFAPYAQNGIVYGGKWDVVTFSWGGDPIGDDRVQTESSLAVRRLHERRYLTGSVRSFARYAFVRR
jgi:hypothetical protein